MTSIDMTPIDAEVTSRNNMQDIAIPLRFTDLAANGRRLQVGHKSRRGSEAAETGRTVVLIAAVTVVAIVEVGFEVLTEAEFGSVHLVSMWPHV